MLNKKPCIILLVPILLLGCFVNASNPQKDKRLKDIEKLYSQSYVNLKEIKTCGAEDGSDLRKEITKKFIYSTKAGIQEDESNEAFTIEDSVLPIYNKCLQNNTIRKFEIKFRYLFKENLHCLKVEVDFINQTRFTELLHFNHYRFAYRELGQLKSNFTRIHPIENTKNLLIVRHIHLRPYIICLSLFNLKTDISPKINGTKEISCDQVGYTFREDVPYENQNLCIDIDTPEHFLEHRDHSTAGLTGDLIMVVFIVILLVIVMFTITIINFLLVEKPLNEKRRRLVQYLQRKFNSNDHSQNFISSHDSLNNKLLIPHNNGGPSIVVSDFSSNVSLNGAPSSSNNNLVANTKTNANNDDEAKETDTLLPKSSNQSSSEPSSTASNAFSLNTQTSNNSTNSDNFIPPSNHKVTFSIGETIIEEPTTLETINETTETNDGNEVSVKSVSHLLDDKPWLSSSNLAGVSTNPTMRQSRSQSIVSNSTLLPLDGKK